jgi:hypothetical protein
LLELSGAREQKIIEEIAQQQNERVVRSRIALLVATLRAALFAHGVSNSTSSEEKTAVESMTAHKHSLGRI